jgi:hypothetical protein
MPRLGLSSTGGSLLNCPPCNPRDSRRLWPEDNKSRRFLQISKFINLTLNLTATKP